MTNGFNDLPRLILEKGFQEPGEKERIQRVQGAMLRAADLEDRILRETYSKELGVNPEATSQFSVEDLHSQLVDKYIQDKKG